MNKTGRENAPGRSFCRIYSENGRPKQRPFKGLTREVPYGQARFIQQNTCFVLCTFFIATVGPFKCLYMQCAMTMRKSPARASDGSFRRIRGDGWPSPRHNRGQPFTFAAAPVYRRSGRRRSCNRTRAKIPITQQKSVPNGHGLLLLVCGGDEGDRTPYLLNAIQALSQVSYTPTGLLPFGNRV